MENVSMDETSIKAFFKFKFKKTEPAEISLRTRVCIHCSLRKQKCRLKSTINGWQHFGQSEQRKSSVLFAIQSEKGPDSGFFTCDGRQRNVSCPLPVRDIKGIIERRHDLRPISFKHQWCRSSFSSRCVLICARLYTLISRFR